MEIGLRIALSFEFGTAILDPAEFREDFGSRTGEAQDH